MLKSQSVYTFTDQPALRNLAAKKLTVQSNRINGIDLRQLLNATTTKQVSGTKVFKSVEVVDLSVQETINTVPLKFLEPLSNQKPLELRDGFEFQGNINVKHLIVGGLNGINVSKVMEDVFLNGERNVIRGNLIIQNAATVNQLTTQSIMGMPSSELMTTSTDQTVSTNIFINRFHATTLAINTLNDENLGQVVALINDHNIIEGKVIRPDCYQLSNIFPFQSLPNSKRFTSSGISTSTTMKTEKFSARRSTTSSEK